MFEHYVILEAYSSKVKRSNKVIIKAFAKDEEDKLMEYNKVLDSRVDYKILVNNTYSNE